jgi:hypothetical protein
MEKDNNVTTEKKETNIVPVEETLTKRKDIDKTITDGHLVAKQLIKLINSKKGGLYINDERYIEYGEWQLVGNFYEVAPIIVSSEPTQVFKIRGAKATAKAIHVPTGKVVGSAESYVLTNEKGKAQKPFNQLASLAQTRACSKALRNAIGWVVELAGLPTTPAEEFDEYNESKIRKGERIDVKMGKQKSGSKKDKPRGSSQEKVSEEEKIAREEEQKYKKKKENEPKGVVDGEFKTKNSNTNLDEQKNKEKLPKKEKEKTEIEENKKEENKEYEQEKITPSKVDPDIRMNMLMERIEDKVIEKGLQLREATKLKIAIDMRKEELITEEELDNIRGRLGYKKRK